MLFLTESYAYIRPWQGMWSRSASRNGTRSGTSTMEVRNKGLHRPGIDNLYSSADPVEDPYREFRKSFVALGVTRAKPPVQKSDREQQLDGFIKGEWILKVRHSLVPRDIILTLVPYWFQVMNGLILNVDIRCARLMVFRKRASKDLQQRR